MKYRCFQACHDRGCTFPQKRVVKGAAQDAAPLTPNRHNVPSIFRKLVVSEYLQAMGLPIWSPFSFFFEKGFCVGNRTPQVVMSLRTHIHTLRLEPWIESFTHESATASGGGRATHSAVENGNTVCPIRVTKERARPSRARCYDRGSTLSFVFRFRTTGLAPPLVPNRRNLALNISTCFFVLYISRPWVCSSRQTWVFSESGHMLRLRPTHHLPRLLTT